MAANNRSVKMMGLWMMILLFLSACTSIGTSTATQAVEPKSTETPQITAEFLETRSTPKEEKVTADVPTASPETETEVNTANSLSPDPISQSFEASDGVQLNGTFYPAAQINAPLIVLFHWAPGDQTAWGAIAPWLQNRGIQPESSGGGQPWLDSTWFPEVPEDVSLNVFAFTFRGCEGGCQRFDREGWLLDAAAVMNHVSMLENVDHFKVATIGASIGGDGAVYACHDYNMAHGGCLGALSLSPGGYLTLPYAQEVADLGSEDYPVPAWCLYSSGDGESAYACENASGDHYQAIAYTGGAHGLAMIEPGREPNPLTLMLEFLNQIGICEGCQ